MNKILNWLRSLLPLGRDARIGSVVLTQGTASPTKKGTQPPSIRTSVSRGLSHQDSWPNANEFSPLPTNSMILSLYDQDFWRNTDVEEVLQVLNWRDPITAEGDNGQTLLHWAAAYTEKSSVIELLLDRGADINARDINSFTPLHRAARDNKGPAVIELLLDRGADISARGGGGTPLHVAAAFNEEPAVIKLLIDRGADINARGVDGVTPLHLATGNNKEAAVIELLLDRGPTLMRG